MTQCPANVQRSVKQERAGRFDVPDAISMHVSRFDTARCSPPLWVRTLKTSNLCRQCAVNTSLERSAPAMRALFRGWATPLIKTIDRLLVAGCD